MNGPRCLFVVLQTVKQFTLQIWSPFGGRKKNQLCRNESKTAGVKKCRVPGVSSVQIFSLKAACLQGFGKQLCAI